VSGLVAGKDAVRIMVEEIGEVIGGPRLREFERKVRAKMAVDFPTGGTANDWINAMAAVIVEDNDTRADQGFRKGIRRIRTQAGELVQ
jgi:hypothetical protein